MGIVRGVEQVLVIQLAEDGGHLKVAVSHRVVWMLLNDSLEATNRAVIIEYVEALVAFAHQWVQVQRIGVFGRDLGCAAGLKRNDGKTQTQAAQQPRIEGGSKAGRSHLG